MGGLGWETEDGPVPWLADYWTRAVRPAGLSRTDPSERLRFGRNHVDGQSRFAGDRREGGAVPGNSLPLALERIGNHTSGVVVDGERGNRPDETIRES